MSFIKCTCLLSFYMWLPCPWLITVGYESDFVLPAWQLESEHLKYLKIKLNKRNYMTINSQ